jgi:hypothetical protein
VGICDSNAAGGQDVSPLWASFHISSNDLSLSVL